MKDIQQSEGLSAALAEFAAGTRVAEGAALEVMRLSVLDWAAVGRAGRNEPVARILRDQAIADGGAPAASVLGTSQKLPPRLAAQVNGTASHALDYDDTHFAHIGHPSVAVVPAALAVAELTGAAGEEMLGAALVGAEGSVRVGLWLGRSHYESGFHQTGTAGAFGATMAAARLLRLDAEHTAHALGIAATRASGLKSQFGTMGKPLNAGIAAQTGVEAAQLAARGFRSNPAGIECQQGFGPTHAGEGALRTALEGLGEDYLFTAVQHKFHACCHGLHAMLEALRPMAAEGCEPDRIARVVVTVHPRWLRVCNQPEPRSGLEAKFSYRLTAAMGILGLDTGALDTFSDKNARDRRLCALRDRVEVATDTALPETAARVQLEFADGAHRSLSHDLDSPLPLQERAGRIEEKARALLGPRQAQELAGALAAPLDLARLAAVLRAG